MNQPQKSNESAEKLREGIVAFSLAVAAAVAIKIPVLFGLDLDQNEEFYVRNLSLFIFPILTGYFIWKRSTNKRHLTWLGVAFISAVLFANLYPFTPNADTEVLTALHLPVALWLIVGIAYTGGNWNKRSSRMTFIRFSGELFIYYVLIALGGGVLMACMAFIFQTIAIDIEPFFESWILPCGSVSAVMIAAWLVEIKQGAVENLAPVLARLFTPLFAIVLLTFLGTLIWTGRAMEFERNVLIALDMLLVVVLGLLLYSISSRPSETAAGFFDVNQIILLAGALLVDLAALWSIGGRIFELGFTPNRMVALGINLILLVNLSGSALLYLRFLIKRAPYKHLEKWQTGYLTVYAFWAAFVVIIIPPLFGFA